MHPTDGIRWVGCTGAPVHCSTSRFLNHFQLSKLPPALRSSRSKPWTGARAPPVAEAGKDGDTTVAVVVAEAGKDMDADAMVAEGVAEAAPPHQLLPPPPTVRRSTQLRHRPVPWTTQRRLWEPALTCALVTPSLLTSVRPACSAKALEPAGVFFLIIRTCRVDMTPNALHLFDEIMRGVRSSLIDCVVIDLMDSVVFCCSEGTSAEGTAEGPGRA